MQIAREKIDPDKARTYLSLNKRNRNFKPSHAERLARMMQAGDWHETHQGIAFNCDGSLRDGQHRLAAVIESGTTQYFWVARGVKDDAIMFIDDHAKRSDADAYQILGLDISRDEVHVARSILDRLAGHVRYSRADLLKFIEEYRDGLLFACDTETRKRGVYQAAVRAVLAMAFYSADRDRLVAFVQALHSGEVANAKQDNSVLRLRDWILQLPSRKGGGAHRTVVFNKTQSALSAFLSYQPLQNLKEKSGIVFPLPGWDGSMIGLSE